MGQATQQRQRMGGPAHRAGADIREGQRPRCRPSPVQTSFKIYARRLGQRRGRREPRRQSVGGRGRGHVEQRGFAGEPLFLQLLGERSQERAPEGHENIWQAGRGLDHDPADQTTHRHGLPERAG